MATLSGSTLNKNMFNGAYGNLSISDGKIELASASVGDMAELLAPTPGLDLKVLIVMTDGLGTDVTIDVGFDGDDSIASGVDVSASGNLLYHLTDIETADMEKITATIGGASATGSLTLRFFYESKGAS